MSLELAGDRLGDIHELMTDFASSQGLDLGRIFHERSGSGTAMTALMTELHRITARHVIVPTRRHLEELPESARALVRHLPNLRPPGQVWSLDRSENRAGLRWLRSGVWPEVPSDAVVLGEFTCVADLREMPTASIHLHEILTRAGLGSLAMPVESVVRVALSDAARAIPAHRDNPVYAQLAAEKNLLSIRLLQRQTTVLVEAYEPVSDRRHDPLPAELFKYGSPARMIPLVGGILTWCEISTLQHDLVASADPFPTVPIPSQGRS